MRVSYVINASVQHKTTYNNVLISDCF